VRCGEALGQQEGPRSRGGCARDGEELKRIISFSHKRKAPGGGSRMVGGANDYAEETPTMYGKEKGLSSERAEPKMAARQKTSQ